MPFRVAHAFFQLRPATDSWALHWRLSPALRIVAPQMPPFVVRTLGAFFQRPPKADSPGRVMLGAVESLHRSLVLFLLSLKPARVMPSLPGVLFRAFRTA